MDWNTAHLNSHHNESQVKTTSWLMNRFDWSTNITEQLQIAEYIPIDLSISIVKVLLVTVSFLALIWQLIMPWAKGILLFTMVVTTLSSSLRADSKAFSETGASYGAVSENTVRSGKLLIVGQGTVSDNDMKTSGLRSLESNEGNLRCQIKMGPILSRDYNLTWIFFLSAVSPC